MEEYVERDYIGDGVYAEFDGYGVTLRANDPNNPESVYLERSVYDALKRVCDKWFNVRPEVE